MRSTLIDVRQANILDITPMADLLKQLFAIEQDFQFVEEKNKKGLLLMLEGCGKHKTIMGATARRFKSAVPC